MKKDIIKISIITVLSALVFMMALPTPAMAQTKASDVVTGTVYEPDGSPCVGATVVVEGSKAYAVTDFDGRFSIEAKESDKITISFLGFKPFGFTVGSRSNYKITMEPDEAMRLNASVSIGYGTVAKKDLTGSVTAVSMDDIKDAPVTSVDQALQGRIAGADIMSTTGEPGATTSIRIRGTRSITASNEPLYIVDGVMDAIHDLNDLNSGDIAEITVLKDASSTAIYGSRGSNGVILITTKKGTGSAGKPNITFQADAGFSQLPRGLDIMNASEFAQYRNDYAYTGNDANNSGVGKNTPLSSSVYSDPFSLGEGTDWIKEITRTALYMKYSLSLTQSTDKSSYYASFSYDDTQGIIKDSGQKRFTGRINLSTQLFKWLTVGYTGSYTWRRNDQNKAEIGGTAYYNAAMYLSPIMKPTDTYNPLYYSGQKINTPTSLIEQNTYYMERHSTNHVFNLDLHPIENFSVNSTLSYYLYQRHTYRYYPGTLPKKTENEGGEAYRAEWDEHSFDWETTATYKLEKKEHHADFLVGFSAYAFGSHNFTLSGSGYMDDNIKWNNMNAVLDKETYSAATAYSKTTKESFFARVNYNWKSKYYITATARYDGASNFAANNKWAFFPSAALKWNIANENFMKNCKWIDDLSLRLSAGVSGNDAISAFQSLAALSTTTSGYLFDGSQPVATYRSRLASPDLTWERTTLYNLGIDWFMFGGRLNITAEGYLSYTRDLLLWLAVADQTGYSSRLTNIGRTSNKGVELSIDSRNIVKPNFSWTTSFTISHNSQMVEDIGTEDFISAYNSPGNNSYMIYGYEKGYPLNALWGFKYGGTWKNQDEVTQNKITKTYAVASGTSNGQPRYYDINHDGILSQDDLVYLGNADPYIYGGLQNTFHIFGFKVGVYFAYSLGGKIYNYSEFYMAGSTFSNQYRYMLNAWHAERNPDSDIPVAGGKSDAALPSDFMVHDASFLRLKNVSIGYTFDLAKCKWLRDITLTASGENLYLWKNYNGFDPDVSTSSDDSTLRRIDLGAYPKSRTIVFSLQIRY